MVTSKNVVVITNKELDIVSADDNYREFVCEDGADTVFANIHPDDQHLLYEMVETLSGKPEVSLCFRVCNKKGDYSWVNAYCSKIKEGEDENVRIELHDLSNLEDGNKAIDIDYLTGLFNKKAINIESILISLLFIPAFIYASFEYEIRLIYILLSSLSIIIIFNLVNIIFNKNKEIVNEAVALDNK